MKKNVFRVNFTIDCEATQDYVNDPELGRLSARGFRDVLEKYGMKGTFFLLPGDAKSDPEFYRELPERGHEVGLHLHPADEGIIEGIKSILEDEGCELVPATMASMAEEYRRRVSKVNIREVLKLDRRAFRGKKPE